MATLSSVLGARLKRNWAGTATVSSWTDDLGVSNAAQATAGRQPTVTTSPASKTVLSFSSNGTFGTSADFMVANAAGASATPRYTLACGVCRVTAGFGNDGNGCALFQIGTGGTGGTVYIFPGLDNTLRAAGFNNTAFAWSASGINDNLWHTWIVIWDSTAGTCRIYVDGVLQTGFSAGTAASINLSTSQLYFGASDTAGDSAYQGFLGDVGLAQDTTAFTTGDISAVHGALREWIQLAVTVPVTAASVAFAGKTVNVTATRAVAVSAASVPFSGKTVGVAVSRATSIDAASIPFSGKSVGVTAARTVDVGAASVPFAVGSVAIGRTSSVPVSAASIPFSAGTVSIGRGTTVTVSPASITFGGQTLGIKRGLSVIAGSIAFSGKTLGVTASRATAVSPASASFSGKTVTVVVQRRASVAPTSASFSGKALGVTATRLVVVGAASIPFSGNTLDVFVTPVSSNSVHISTLSIPFSGGVVGIQAARRLSIDSAALPFAGQDVATHRGRTVAVSPASISFAGQDVALRRSFHVPVEALAIPFAGKSLTVRFSTSGASQSPTATISLSSSPAVLIDLRSNPATSVDLLQSPAVVIDTTQVAATQITLEYRMTLYVGDTNRLKFTFRDPDTNDLVDPSAMWVEVAEPNVSPVIYTFSIDDNVTRLSLGVYQCAVDCTSDGHWKGEAYSPGPIGKGVKPFDFYVQRANR